MQVDWSVVELAGPMVILMSVILLAAISGKALIAFRLVVIVAVAPVPVILVQVPVVLVSFGEQTLPPSSLIVLLPYDALAVLLIATVASFPWLVE